MGQTVTQGLTGINEPSLMSWETRPASDFPNGPSDVAVAVVNEQCWAAITSQSFPSSIYFRSSMNGLVVSVNPLSTAKLNASVVSPDPSYDGSQAVTAYVNEARQENG
jgi:hypothetical protein